MSNQLIDTPRSARPVRSAKWQAGRDVALSDFRRCSLRMPVKGDEGQWAAGYREAVAELAGTFGRESIVAMGGKL